MWETKTWKIRLEKARGFQEMTRRGEIKTDTCIGEADFGDDVRDRVERFAGVLKKVTCLLLVDLAEVFEPADMGLPSVVELVS